MPDNFTLGVSKGQHVRITTNSQLASKYSNIARWKKKKIEYLSGYL